MKLYDFWRSTAAYRVRIALNLRGLEISRQDIDLFEGKHQEQAFRAVNPQGMVPALVLDDGTVLTQSLPIIEYLEERYPETPLLPADPVTKAQVRAAALAIAADIHPVQNMAVANRVEALAPGNFKRWIEETMTHRLPGLEALLAANEGSYSFGETVTLADLCLVPQLYNAKALDLDLSPYPRLQAIDAACLALPAFTNAAPKEAT